jgi:hypothetical protein
MFLGLGVNIKYPADFSRAPYTTIACGVTTLPQRVAFPFALVNQPSQRLAGIPPGYNEIIPAWLLTESLYTLLRNQLKHRVRNMARRTRFELEVFRPETIELMRDACQRLEAVPRLKELYTERDIVGLGKNVLLETNRHRAVWAYRFHLEHYALLGLKDAVAMALHEGRPELLRQLLYLPSQQQPWELQRRILRGEMELTDIRKGLRRLPEYQETVANAVERSKAKDDERGPCIIDDYAQAHGPARNDPLVLQAWEETCRIRREVEELILPVEPYLQPGDVSTAFAVTNGSLTSNHELPQAG